MKGAKLLKYAAAFWRIERFTYYVAINVDIVPNPSRYTPSTHLVSS